MARTGEEGPRGITAFLVPGDAAGLSGALPERKMGMKGSPTAQVHFDGVRVPDARRIGEEGQGFAIALAALDSGRLGIAACAIGLAQSALDEALAYASGRRQFGRPISDFEGLRFMLADRRRRSRPAGRCIWRPRGCATRAGPSPSRPPWPSCTAPTHAMKVTTDAVQVLGGYGYTADFPAERYMREAKALRSSRARIRSSGWSSPVTSLVPSRTERLLSRRRATEAAGGRASRTHPVVVPRERPPPSAQVRISAR